MKKSLKYQRKIIAKYEKAGVEFGSMLGLCYMGKPLGYFMAKRKFLRLEKKIARMGYSPKPIEEFVKRALSGGTDWVLLAKGYSPLVIKKNKEEISEYEKVMKESSFISRWVNFVRT